MSDDLAQQGHARQVWQYRRVGREVCRGVSRMHAIIAGCGRVGSELGMNLVRLGHTVSIIDKDPRAFERLVPEFEARRIMGFVFDRDVLEEAGIKEADAFASVTSGDNSNILSARTAKEYYKVPHVVARIYDPRRAQIYQRLGIQTVATVRWTTDQILRFLAPEEMPVEHTVDNGEVVVSAIDAPRELVGRKAIDLDRPGTHRVVAVSRYGVPRLPDDNLTIQDGDIIHVAVLRSELGALSEELTGWGGAR